MVLLYRYHISFKPAIEVIHLSFQFSDPYKKIFFHNVKSGDTIIVFKTQVSQNQYGFPGFIAMMTHVINIATAAIIILINLLIINNNYCNSKNLTLYRN